MFDPVIYLLARDHDRELMEAAVRGRRARRTSASLEARRRRLAAELRLLRTPGRRG